MAEDLKHVGVKGMKWGIRRGKRKGLAKASGPLGYKTSADHAKDLANSWKAKKVNDVAVDVTKGSGKAAFEFAVGFVAVYGTMVTIEKLLGG